MGIYYSSGLQPFWHQGLVPWERVFSIRGLGVGEDGLGMTRVHDMYCAFCLYLDYIGPTSDHQALDPGGWGPRRLIPGCQIQYQLSIINKDR